MSQPARYSYVGIILIITAIGSLQLFFSLKKNADFDYSQQHAGGDLPYNFQTNMQLSTVTSSSSSSRSGSYSDRNNKEKERSLQTPKGTNLRKWLLVSGYDIE